MDCGFMYNWYMFSCRCQLQRGRPRSGSHFFSPRLASFTMSLPPFSTAYLFSSGSLQKIIVCFEFPFLRKFLKSFLFQLLVGPGLGQSPICGRYILSYWHEPSLLSSAGRYILSYWHEPSLLSSAAFILAIGDSSTPWKQRRRINALLILGK